LLLKLRARVTVSKSTKQEHKAQRIDNIRLKAAGGGGGGGRGRGRRKKGNTGRNKEQRTELTKRASLTEHIPRGAVTNTLPLNLHNFACKTFKIKYA
jgi:hypothetical protein